jgi:hypothetical protein
MDRFFFLKVDEEITYDDIVTMISTFIVLSSVTVIPALILVAKIYNMIKFKDIPMLASIFAVSLSLLFFIGYCACSLLEE